MIHAGVPSNWIGGDFVDTNKYEISYDPAKRARCYVDRGLDFESAPKVFAGPTYEEPSMREGVQEPRVLTVGFLEGRMVIVIWTPRNGKRHIISMRKCNAQERYKYGIRF